MLNVYIDFKQFTSLVKYFSVKDLVISEVNKQECDTGNLKERR